MLTPEQTDLDKLAKSLTKAQRVGLERLANRMVYVDGRSLNALERRKLARIHWSGVDPMIGGYTLATITPLGLALRNHLKGQNDGKKL